MGGFTSRSADEKKALLRDIGVSSIDDLFAGIPAELGRRAPLNLPQGISETEAFRELARLAGQNASCDSWNAFLGAGIYDHFIPAATGALTSRSEFLTAYTPYQAEVSQGTLQSIYEYQSLICELTGNEVSNASMYDGATALAEAVIMAQAVQKKGTQFVVPESLNPLYARVLDTYMKGLGITLVKVRHTGKGGIDLDHLKSLLNAEVFGVAVQTPNIFGVVEDIKAVAALKTASPFVLVAVPNLVSLAVLEAPGKQGADICVGEAHYFASGPSFGGPLLGFMATHASHIRQIPGRIVGKTLDRDGKRGFVLTAQTREQHIRREKATSNICSNEGLLALAATITLSLLGKEGLCQMAQLNISKTQYAMAGFKKKKSAALPFSGPVFNEFAVDLKGESLDALFTRAAAKKIIPGVRLDKLDPAYGNRLLVCVTERKTKADIDELLGLFA